MDRRKHDSAIPISEGTVRSANESEKLKVTTRGWDHLVRFKVCSLDWVKLKDSKNLASLEWLSMLSLIESLMNLLTNGGCLKYYDVGTESIQGEELLLAYYAQVWSPSSSLC